MQPEAVAAFITAYGNEVNAGRADQSADRRREESELGQIVRRLDGLYDAIADGLRTTGLKAKLEDLEARRAELESKLAAPLPSPVRIHPNLSEIYRRKVEELAQTLADPDIHIAALDSIRSLIETVTVYETDDGVQIALEGAITALIGLAQPGADLSFNQGSVKVVAGVGFEPTTFRL